MDTKKKFKCLVLKYTMINYRTGIRTQKPYNSLVFEYVKLSLTSVVRAVVKVNITLNINQEMSENLTRSRDQLIKTH